MDDILIHEISLTKKREIVLVSGLPGVGNIGKITVDHILSVSDCSSVAKIYSQYLPCQVIPDKNGVVDIISNSLHFFENKSDDGYGYDILFWSGDSQPQSNEGQFIVAKRIFDYINSNFIIKRIITLGGYGTGEMTENPHIYGAVSHEDVIDELKKYDVKFVEGIPKGGIVGINGVLVGFGKLENIPSMCIMSETSGYFPDPSGALAIIKVLSKMLGISPEISSLEEKARDTQSMVKELIIEMKKTDEISKRNKDDLKYIG